MLSSLRNRIALIGSFMREAFASFSWRGRLGLLLLIGAGIVALVAALALINQRFLTSVPATGGVLSEGVIGTPRFINPLLAVTDTDRDLSLLIYAGLLRVTGEGTFVPNLAESYTVSDDGLVYTFTLRDGLTFHDKNPLTTEDVVFTVLRAQDPALKSPKRPNWEGVKVEAVSLREVRFTLSKPYAPFLENTTLGILPKHIWEGAPVEEWVASTFNLRPIGSGAFKFTEAKEDASGIPTSYLLSAWNDFVPGRPNLDALRVSFFPNQEVLLAALRKGTIEAMHSMSGSTAQELATEGFRIIETPLPRMFGVFLNASQASLFGDKAVRLALGYAIDRTDIINKALFGYGTPLFGPIPPGSLGYKEVPAVGSDFDLARTTLEKAGWVRGEDGIYIKKERAASKGVPAQKAARLSFTLTTPDVPELKHVAELVAQSWQSLGAEVVVVPLNQNDLNQNVLRPRKYDALLFGEIVGRESDLFAFWHSSQRGDPGLNIALYTNRAGDTILEETRTILDRQKAEEAYQLFASKVIEDAPAIFLYSPTFLYLLPEDLSGINIPPPNISGERWSDVADWYKETDRVWNIFLNK